VHLETDRIDDQDRRPPLSSESSLEGKGQACLLVTEVRSLVGSNLSQEAGSHQTPAQDAEPLAWFTEPGSGRQWNCLELSAAQSDR
jgi:hypothetical protein